MYVQTLGKGVLGYLLHVHTVEWELRNFVHPGLKKTCGSTGANTLVRSHPFQLIGAIACDHIHV